jgi:hypothetical protein
MVGDDLDREGRLGLRLIDWLAREESQGWFKKTRWLIVQRHRQGGWEI